MKRVAINRDRRLRDDPNTGHNRWHPAIEPIISVDPGEIVELQTRDASDGQVQAGMTPADLQSMDAYAAHPLTGPVWINGAQPGDLLEIEFIDIVAQDYGWTRVRPGAGFLRDYFDQNFLAHWHVSGGFARSEQIPGVRIPDSAFMGTSGVAPSADQLANWSKREADFVEQGGLALLPIATDAVPGTEPVASEGLRTMPPRENGGNADIKQLTKGSKLQLPVNVAGALFSTGDAHFAQGDSECCITAIEMGATVTLRFKLYPQLAAQNNIRLPRFSHPGFFLPPQWAAPGNLIGTVGYPINPDGTQGGEDLTLAARNALLQMIQLLGERGYSREQAYVICSVAVDLRISNAVDLPNVTVSALLPQAIFD